MQAAASPASARRELAAARLPASGYLFRRHDGAPGPNAPGLVSQLAARALRDAGVSATLHQLRHRFGTRTYQASHDIRVVQELMGHQSPVTTAAYIRRRHWWDAEPPALAAGIGTGPDDEDPDDGEWDDGDPDDDPGSDGREMAPAAAPDPGRPAGLTWAGALAAAGWRLSPSPGGCQVIGQDGQLCGAPGADRHVTARPVGDAWICGAHYEDLSVIITRGAA